MAQSRLKQPVGLDPDHIAKDLAKLDISFKKPLFIYSALQDDAENPKKEEHHDIAYAQEIITVLENHNNDLKWNIDFLATVFH